jgi:hypothetical protein
LTGQGIVHVHSLHKAESGYHQDEKQRRVFTEQRALELGFQGHSGLNLDSLSNLDAQCEPAAAKVGLISAQKDRATSVVFNRG